MSYWEQCKDKGELGELWVELFLKRKGYKILDKHCFKKSNGGHLIDFKIESASGKVCYLDVKCKDRRVVYADTGFDTDDYYKYQKIDKKHEVIVVYVDGVLGGAYWQSMADMQVERICGRTGNRYPLHAKRDRQGKLITYTLCCSLTRLFGLSDKMKKIYDSLPDARYE